MRGITVTLHEKVRTGTDRLNRPVYEEVPVDIKNVLVAPATAEDIPSGLDLNGAKVEYQLALPKGDTHVWNDSRVTFFGQDWHVVAPPVMGIEDLIPLSWNKKVMVERYE